MLYRDTFSLGSKGEEIASHWDAKEKEGCASSHPKPLQNLLFILQLREEDPLWCLPNLRAKECNNPRSVISNSVSNACMMIWILTAKEPIKTPSIYIDDNNDDQPSLNEDVKV